MTATTNMRTVAGQQGAMDAAYREGWQDNSEHRRYETVDECWLVSETHAALVASSPPSGEALETYYARQIEWSKQTFGPARRTKGILDHIRKELAEIAAKPDDLSEWVDVVILAMDGFWRHGGGASDLMPALIVKQAKNIARQWPDWRTMSEDSAIEHDRSGDAALSVAPATADGWRLVPDEPTLAQQNAGWREVDKQGFSTEDTEIAPIYRAMIAAAPTTTGGRG